MPTWWTRDRPALHLGHADHPFLRFPYHLGPAELRNHKHVIGLTGQGKSKLLAAMFAQLHLQGVGCALIDPHSDLAGDVLALLTDAGYFRRPDAFTRLLYVDFRVRNRFLPFNVIDQPYPAHQIADWLVEVCLRAWPALAGGAAPTFENILRHSVIVLVHNDRLPLTNLAQLLTDQPYRDQLLTRVHDPQVIRFFRDRYDQWGKEAPLMRESTLNRVDLLTLSPTLRYSLGQQRNALDFRRLMDEGISVVFNLGGLDEQTQRFLGALVCRGFEVAALSREDQPEHQRRHYELLMDEFSMFSSQSEEGLSRILSLARKYRLFLTMAHQTFSQLNARLQGALQNTVSIAFKLGRSDAQWAAPRFGRFEEEAVKHLVDDEHAQDRSHPVYWSIPETFERWTQALEDLTPRRAYVRVGRHTARIVTRRVPRPRCTPDELAAIAEHYATALMTPAAYVIPMIDAPQASMQSPLSRRVRTA